MNFKNKEAFKHLFQEACKQGEETMQSFPNHRNKYSEAYAILSLMEGVSYGEGRLILQEAIGLLGKMERANTINAAQVFKTIIPFNL